MSTRGSRSRDFLDISLTREEITSDGMQPYSPKWRLVLNNVYLDVDLRQKMAGAFKRGSWSISKDMLSTPWFFAMWGADQGFAEFFEPRVHGDFSEQWWDEKRWTS